FQNAEKDHHTRLLGEARFNAQKVISGLQKALDETPDILNNEEKKVMASAINALQKSVNSDNQEEILLKMKQLNKLATDFMQRHLDAGARLMLEGKHIDKV